MHLSFYFLLKDYHFLILGSVLQRISWHWVSKACLLKSISLISKELFHRNFSWCSISLIFHSKKKNQEIGYRKKRPAFSSLHPPQIFHISRPTHKHSQGVMTDCSFWLCIFLWLTQVLLSKSCMNRFCFMNLYSYLSSPCQSCTAIIKHFGSGEEREKRNSTENRTRHLC